MYNYQLRNLKRKPKDRKFFLGISLVFLLIAWFLYSKYHTYTTTPVDPQDDTMISFQVQRGDSIEQIGENLEESGLTWDDFAFYLYVRLNDLDEGIVAGRFLLNKTMTVPQIAAIISDPSQAEFVITIQEGLTIADIEDRLIELSLVEDGEFLDAVSNFSGWEYYPFLDPGTSLEGYLFPDTYFLDPVEFEPHDFIYLALDNFERKFEEFLENLGTRSIHEIVTMASLIENEVVSAEDRALVSGILWKRFDNGWILGVDAALLYVTEDRVITAEDLEIDSPYNIRKYAGLPPGPIGNPGLSSLRAAIYPQESKYWFYLTASETGEVIYAVTNEAHNVNRAQYL